MNEKPQSLAMSNDPRVQAALADYFAQIDSGESLNVEDFLKRYSDIASELQSVIDVDQQARRMTGGAAPDADTKQSNAPMPLSSRSQAEVSTHSAIGGIDGTFGGKLKPLEPSAEVSFLSRSTGDLPDIFGRYRVLRKLGSGAMGAVYLADDTVLHRRVALKTPTFEDDTDGELLRRFYREARAVANLKHPNLCAVYDVGEIDGRHYISMEFVRGKKLQDYIRPDKPMTEKQIMAVVRRIALAMHVAHTHGVIHRDLKPDNIMVNEKGEPVVMDFGLVHKTESKNSTRITQRGMLVGSPAYMSKEQVEGDSEKLTGATDQYSLGVILYQLLTSKLPFEGGIHGVLAAILTKDPAPPSQLQPEVNPHLEAVCLKMMAKDAKERYPSMKAVADTISRISRGSLLDSKPSDASLSEAQTPADPIVSVGRALNRPRVMDAPANEVRDSQFKRPRPIQSRMSGGEGRPPSHRLLYYGASAVVLFLLGIIYWIRSGDALIRVDVLSDDIEVRFHNEKFTIVDGQKSLTVKPGDHLLHIKSGDVEFDTGIFALKRGDNPVVTVAIEDAHVVAKLGDQEISRRARLMKVDGQAATSLPATAINKEALPNTAAATSYLTPRIAELQRDAREDLATELASGTSADLTKAANLLLTRVKSGQETEEKLALVDLARELFAQAGNIQEALNLCQRMKLDFDVDAVVTKTQTLRRLAQLGGSEDLREKTLTALLTTGNEALKSDKFGPSQEAARIASTIAKLPDRHDYEYQTRFLSEELERTKSAYDQLPAMVRSADYVTADADQNSLRGQYECLIKNDWVKGIDLLLAGTETWKHLGQKEESRPTTAADKLSLGDLWWQAADESPATMADSARRRARYWYLSALSQLKPDQCAETAKRLILRIDAVPRNPITLRVRMTGLNGYHWIRITNDGVQTTGRGGRKITGDIVVNHLRWKDQVSGHKNLGASRLLPAAVDFSTARVLNVWHSRWGAVNVTRTPDYVELTFWHCPSNETSSFDLTLEVESDGFNLPSRFSPAWDVNYYAWPQKNAPMEMTARDKFFSSEPLDKLKLTSINFISDASPLDAWRPGAPPTKKVGAEHFAFAANSDWELPAGLYQAAAFADDGIRLLIDGKVVIDNWCPPNAKWNADPKELRLTAGSHRVRVEYCQATGPGNLQFGLKRLGD